MSSQAQDRAERRLAAILAADVVGYSRLIGEDEEGTLRRLRRVRAEIVDPAIAAHRGRIVKTTGDGLLVEFSSVVDAVRCAAAWQAAMPADRAIAWRIGIHQGDIVVEDGDIFGDGVNIAARLEGLAEPGGICVSARVQEDAAGRLDLDFEHLGEQALKNIARPVRVFRVTGSRASLPRASEAPAVQTLPSPDKPSIAVLPFQNLSGDPEQEYFADGMVEEIITALSKIRWFFVIARNSTFTYKGRAVDVKQVARELGVRYVLEGSVRRAGNRLRVTAQLVEAETGNHVWAERYDRDLSDIFAVQDEITERVAAAIEPELYAAENIRSQRKVPESLDAWECVIRALSQMGQGTRESTLEAEALCRRAIAIAPDYANAHALLAWILLRLTTFVGKFHTMVPEIELELQAARALDDRDPWAPFAGGNLLNRLRRFDESTRTLRRALELNPNFAPAHAFLALALAHSGAYEEAVETAQHALRLSPRDRSVGAYASLAIALVHYMAGHYAESTRWARRVVDNNPEWVGGWMNLAAGLGMQGETAAAAAARDVLLRLFPEFSLAWMAENTPPTGEHAERLKEGLRKAGVPEA